MAALVVALLVIGEQFPFSYFPMYSSFDPRADYYYVADSAGQPLACVQAFRRRRGGITGRASSDFLLPFTRSRCR